MGYQYSGVCKMKKVKYVGRKPIPVFTGVNLHHVEGDVFETDTPELLPDTFQALGEKPPAADPEGDSEPESSKKSRKRVGGKS